MTARGTSFVDGEIASLKEAGLYFTIRTLQSAQASTATIDGKRVINLSSNNYLGLNTHPRLVKAAIEATEKYGVGAGAVRSIIGTMTPHVELEERLAKFKHTEAALTFQSGVLANQAAVGTVFGIGEAPGALVISDQLNHASIIDGVRLTKADRAIYGHKNMEELEKVLREAEKYTKILIITDGVFSMDGDVAPLPSIAELAQKFGAITYVDDAHGSGVLGRNGRGSVDHFNLHGKWDVQMGTLSKAVGVVGGYIASTQSFKDLMQRKARPFLFSTALPPAVAAATKASIDLLDSAEGETLITRLWDNTRYFKKELQSLGFNTGVSETPITPITIGDEKNALQFSQRLFEEGIFTQSIAYPTVPKGTARARTIVTATHTKEDLNTSLRAMDKVGKELHVIGK